MKKSILLLIGFLAVHFIGNSQASEFNLKSQNLHKKVAKTITHYYNYHKKSGGFIKQSVAINTYNNDGNLIETYYHYNNTYSKGSSTTSKLYNYNSKNQLINTEDISRTKGKYSSTYQFHYNNKGNLTKKELHYNDGSKSNYNYSYDRKNRLIRKEYYSSKGILSSKTTYLYSGKKRTEVNTSYNTKDGSITGTYTTSYKNNIKTAYKSDSKYGKSNTTYRYDKNDNLIASNYTGKNSSTTKYNYVYDNKKNWIKKHYSSGKYNYFYFREIIFKNGNTTGSSDFDKNFINRHGNFDNVNVVAINHTKNTTTKKATTSTEEANMPVFKHKNWIFNYVNLKDKVSALSGEVNLNVTDNNKMSKNSTVKISYSFAGKNYSGIYTVSSYTHVKDYGFWTLKSTTKSAKITISIYDKKKYISAKDIYLDGILMLLNDNKKSSFYLE